MSRKDTKMGRLVPIENTNPGPTEAKQYIRVWVEDADGTNERPLLLTEHDLQYIEQRTTKQLEDWGERGVVQNLFD